jgi:hypothetical protein
MCWLRIEANLTAYPGRHPRSFDEHRKRGLIPDADRTEYQARPGVCLIVTYTRENVRMNKVLAFLLPLALAACASMSPGASSMKINLTGTEEVPPLSVPGSGSGTITIGADGSVAGSVTTTGVEGTMAHIHMGARGTNGPVIVPLTKSGDTYSVPAGAKLNEAQMQAFKAGNLYVNVHTNRNKGGEVRAQLQP